MGERTMVSCRWIAVALLACAACPAPSSGDAGSDSSVMDTGIDAIADAAPDDSVAPLDTVVVDTNPPPVPIATWILPRNGPNEFQLPWPSDLTLTPDGFADLTYVPNPAHNTLVAAYQTALAHRIAGFSTVGAIYFRFGEAIDPSTLPADVPSSLASSASVQLLDIDPNSPDHGTRRPAQTYFRTTIGRYWSPNTLAVAPAFGFPLRPHTRYAVVVTTSLHTMDGGPFMRDADFAAMMAPSGGDSAVANARMLHATALTEIAATGVSLDNVVSLAVFTTHDPGAEFFRAVQVAESSTVPVPSFVDITRGFTSSDYVVYQGHYGPNPNFQTGAQPYTDPGTGDYTFDSSGAPVVQGNQNYAFTLTTPGGTAPANGWPIVVYADGTGSRASDVVNEGVAYTMAHVAGVAVFSFDQIFNGERIVGDPTETNAEEEFFNFGNPLAGRTNNQQAGIDLVMAGRFVRQMVIPAATSSTGQDVHFDPTRVMFFGHSQGGLCGPLWLSAESTAGAAILSGTGGTLAISVTEKTQPVNIPEILAIALGISTTQATEELVPLHPVITMAQTVVDAADPVNYGRYVVNEPRAGNIPHDVYQTEGFIDHYAPPDSIETVALSIGLQLVQPVVQMPPLYGLTGLSLGTLPVSQNLSNGMVTGVWQQFTMTAGSDGHFVIYDVPGAMDRAAKFLQSYATSPTFVTVVPM